MTRIDGCPEGMYPLDVYYEGEPHTDRQEFIDSVKAGSNPLNFPLSWFMDNATGVFSVQLLMPRKGNKVWSIRLVGYTLDEILPVFEPVLKDAVKEWYGW